VTRQNISAMSGRDIGSGPNLPCAFLFSIREYYTSCRLHGMQDETAGGGFRDYACEPDVLAYTGRNASCTAHGCYKSLWPLKAAASGCTGHCDSRPAAVKIRNQSQSLSPIEGREGRQLASQ
jgi:hypothetical protein